MVIRAIRTVGGVTFLPGGKEWERPASWYVFNLDGGFLGLTGYTELKMKGEVLKTLIFLQVLSWVR